MEYEIILIVVVGVIVASIVLVSKNRKRNKQAANMPEAKDAIKIGAANFWKTGKNAVGGTLILTKTKIIFQAHGFNMGGTANKINLNLNQLVRVQPAGLGKIEVFDRYNAKYKFRVNDRKTWASLIEDALVQNRENDFLTEGGESLVAAANKQLTEKKNMSTDSDADTLLKLKKLRFEGLITEEEYEAKRQEIIKRM